MGEQGSWEGKAPSELNPSQIQASCLRLTRLAGGHTTTEPNPSPLSSIDAARMEPPLPNHIKTGNQ